MKRILTVLTVAVMMMAMTISPAFASHNENHGGECLFQYNPAAGNFLVVKTTPSGEQHIYSTDRPPKNCTLVPS